MPPEGPVQRHRGGRMENTMSGDIDKINEIFRIHDEAINSAEDEEKKEEEKGKAKKKSGKREKLKEPQITEERKATRTYYYDSKGNKCKKSCATR